MLPGQGMSVLKHAVLPMDEATLKQPVPPAPGDCAASGSVCSAAGCSLVLPQEVSLLKQPVLPQDCLSNSNLCFLWTYLV
jgi:hypothetical protein